jgi:periplasmic protein TonB
MDKKKILQTDILDIIFNERNKEYGAYELRKNYQKRARNAVVISFVFALVAVSAPLIAGFLIDKPQVALPRDPEEFIIRDVETDVKIPESGSTIKKIDEPITPDIPTEIVHPTEVIEPIEPPIDLPIVDPGPQGPEGPELPTGNLDPGTSGGGTATSVSIIELPKEPETTYTLEMGLQQYPEFPGGEDALFNYLSAHIKYPSKAIENEREGKVVIGFVVNKDGEIDEMSVLKSLGYGCDEEAMRVIKDMPKWKAGKNNGKPVKVYYTLPIHFELSPQ